MNAFLHFERRISMKNPSKSHQMHRVCGFGGFRINVWMKCWCKNHQIYRVCGFAGFRIDIWMKMRCKSRQMHRVCGFGGFRIDIWRKLWCKSHQRHRLCGFGGFRIDIWMKRHPCTSGHPYTSDWGASARREPPRLFWLYVWSILEWGAHWTSPRHPTPGCSIFWFPTPVTSQ